MSKENYQEFAARAENLCPASSARRRDTEIQVDTQLAG